MDVYAIRRANLRAIIDERFDGRLAEFARFIDKDPSYLSRYFSTKTQRRNMGARTARQIEQLLGKPHGWMDRAPGGDPGVKELDPALNREAVHVIKQYLKLPRPQRYAVREMISALAQQSHRKRKG